MGCFGVAVTTERTVIGIRLTFVANIDDVGTHLSITIRLGLVATKLRELDYVAVRIL